MCTKSGGLCRVGPNFFYDQVSSLNFNKVTFDAAVISYLHVVCTLLET